jgi:hypothetical protein
LLHPCFRLFVWTFWTNSFDFNSIFRFISGILSKLFAAVLRDNEWASACGPLKTCALVASLAQRPDWLTSAVLGQRSARQASKSKTRPSWTILLFWLLGVKGGDRRQTNVRVQVSLGQYFRLLVRFNFRYDLVTITSMSKDSIEPETLRAGRGAGQGGSIGL